MKVNTGSAKRIRLKVVPGTTTRPITDRVKQALFNIIGDDVRDSRWLDLFAGTGAVGIEALSRGARSCVFVDRVAAATKIVQDNLRATGTGDKAKVIRQDAFHFIAARPNAQFDFIYIAPPQFEGLWSRALLAVDQNIGWLSDNGTVIVQIDPKEFLEPRLAQLELDDQRRYGKTMLCFYSRTS